MIHHVGKIETPQINQLNGCSRSSRCEPHEFEVSRVSGKSNVFPAAVWVDWRKTLGQHQMTKQTPSLWEVGLGNLKVCVAAWRRPNYNQITPQIKTTKVTRLNAVESVWFGGSQKKLRKQKCKWRPKKWEVGIGMQVQKWYDVDCSVLPAGFLHTSTWSSHCASVDCVCRLFLSVFDFGYFVSVKKKRSGYPALGKNLSLFHLASRHHA